MKTGGVECFPSRPNGARFTESYDPFVLTALPTTLTPEIITRLAIGIVGLSYR